jgi:membrane-associated phospholipid phosphatase
LVRAAAGASLAHTFLSIALIAFCPNLQAQTLGTPDPRLWTQSSTGDWLEVGVAAGATAGSYLIEEKVRVVFQENRSGVADVLERVGWWYGTPLFTVPASLLTWGAGAAFGSEDVRDTGLMMSEVMLSLLLIQQPVRIMVGRARPFTGEGHLSFDPFTFGNDHASFVSGHSWSAWGISNVVARQVDQTWAYVSLYTLASITALSRMYADAHWLTDVLLGSIAGYAISTAIWNANQDDPAAPQAALRAPLRRWLMVSLSL